jgi:hypothetical protein
MKTAVCLTAIVAYLTLFAQETLRTASGGLAERFKQLDRNGEGNEIGKSLWYLVRYADGTYRYQRIWDENNPLTNAQYGLRGCRSIRPSPFPEESGRVWYLCGFDQTGARGSGATGSAAWIYKATLPVGDSTSRSTPVTTQEKP